MMQFRDELHHPDPTVLSRLVPGQARVGISSQGPTYPGVSQDKIGMTQDKSGSGMRLSWVIPIYQVSWISFVSQSTKPAQDVQGRPGLPRGSLFRTAILQE